MGSEQDGALFGAQMFDERVDLKAYLRIKSGGGLVEEEQRWIVDEPQSDGEALFLSAGEGGVEGIALLRELQALQQIVRFQRAAVERTEDLQGLDDPDFVGQVGGLQADADTVLELCFLFVGIEAPSTRTSPLVCWRMPSRISAPWWSCPRRWD